MKNIDNKPLPEPAEFHALCSAAKLEAHIRLVVDYNNLAFLTNSLAHQVQELTFALTGLRGENARIKAASYKFIDPRETVEELEAAARKFAPAPAPDTRPPALAQVGHAASLAVQTARALEAAHARSPEELHDGPGLHFRPRLDSQHEQAVNLASRIAKLENEMEAAAVAATTATASAS